MDRARWSAQQHRRRRRLPTTGRFSVILGIFGRARDVELRTACSQRDAEAPCRSDGRRQGMFSPEHRLSRGMNADGRFQPPGPPRVVAYERNKGERIINSGPVDVGLQSVGDGKKVMGIVAPSPLGCRNPAEEFDSMHCAKKLQYSACYSRGDADDAKMTVGGVPRSARICVPVARWRSRLIGGFGRITASSIAHTDHAWRSLTAPVRGRQRRKKIVLLMPQLSLFSCRRSYDGHDGERDNRGARRTVVAGYTLPSVRRVRKLPTVKS